MPDQKQIFQGNVKNLSLPLNLKMSHIIFTVTDSDTPNKYLIHCYKSLKFNKHKLYLKFKYFEITSFKENNCISIDKIDYFPFYAKKYLQTS